MDDTRTQTHFCIISDRFTITDRLTVELAYEFYGHNIWGVTATIMDGSSCFLELYRAREEKPESLEKMMADHRQRVASIFRIAAMKTSVSTKYAD